MAVLDRETLLDLTVNVVPLAIILLFAVAAVAVAPLGRASLFTHLVELGLLAVPFVVLALVSYLAGRAVMRDEEQVEAEHGSPGTVASAGEVSDHAGSAGEAEADVEEAETDVEEADVEEAETEATIGETDGEESDTEEPVSRSETEGEP